MWVRDTRADSIQCWAGEVGKRYESGPEDVAGGMRLCRCLRKKHTPGLQPQAAAEKCAGPHLEETRHKVRRIAAGHEDNRLARPPAAAACGQRCHQRGEAMPAGHLAPTAQRPFTQPFQFQGQAQSRVY